MCRYLTTINNNSTCTLNTFYRYSYMVYRSD